MLNAFVLGDYQGGPIKICASKGESEASRTKGAIANVGNRGVVEGRFGVEGRRGQAMFWEGPRGLGINSTITSS
jgi:hypothetical protein